MPNTLSPLEAAEKLEHLANNDYVDYDDAIEAMRVSSKFIRKIAAGEYKQVVHAQYVTDDFGDSSCSECGENYLDCTKKYCPSCGALMGKDDSHAEK